MTYQKVEEPAPRTGELFEGGPEITGPVWQWERYKRMSAPVKPTTAKLARWLWWLAGGDNATEEGLAELLRHLGSDDA